MSVVSHADLPVHEVPRIRTRILVGAAMGAKETAVWEQWIEPLGYIPLHYHDVEEVLVVLAGDVFLTRSGETTVVRGPATVVLPARVVHGLRPHGDAQVHLLAFFPTNQPRIYNPDGKLRPLPWEDRTVGETPP